MQKLIFLAADFQENKPSPLGIRVFASEEKLSLPSQADLLSNTYIFKNNKIGERDLNYFTGETAFGMAIQIGCIPSLKFLTDNYRLIAYTQFCARKEVVEFILSQKLFLETYLKNPMFVAIKHHDLSLMKLIASNSAFYLNATHLDTLDTPLHAAINEGFIEGVEFLLSQRVFCLIVNRKLELPLETALIKGDLNILKILHLHHLTETEYLGKRPLHQAAQNNNLNRVKLLLMTGVSPVALHKWIKARQAISFTTDPQVKEILLFCMLTEWIRIGDHELVKIALHSKPNLQMRMWNGDTLANFVVGFGTPIILATLIKAGMHINDKGLRGETALHVAARLNKSTMAQVLIDRGADLMAKRKDEKVPEQLTREAKIVEMFEHKKETT